MLEVSTLMLFFLTVPILMNHIRSNHLSIIQELSDVNEYNNLMQNFGDHILEYDNEGSESFRKVHSIL